MDYSPLNASCIRSLTDKLYEKRKVAALEIERSVKELSNSNDDCQLKKILNVLCDLTLSQNPNNRKGGLIGLAAFSIALGKDTSIYVQDLIKPPLSCFYDPDSRVRYYGCESLYNIIKVSRVSVLPFFNDIFDGLNKLSSDPDQNVRSGCELLDRLMKDVVSEASQFDLKCFIPLLRERLLSKNQFSRQFIVSWIKTLDEIPELDISLYLPELLDGLFQILGDNSQEIKTMCESCLGEFLHNITSFKKSLDYNAMINILNFHIQSTDKLIQYTAFVWLHELLVLPMMPILPHVAGILASTLPCLSCNEENSDIRSKAHAVNCYLLEYIAKAKPELNELLPHVDNASLNLLSILQVLKDQMSNSSVNTRLASIAWMKQLFTYVPQQMITHFEELLPCLLKTLSDQSDEVVIKILELISNISSGKIEVYKVNYKSYNDPNKYFCFFMQHLLKLFKENRQLLDCRGPFIIKQLCVMLNAKYVYCCASDIMSEEDDIYFVSEMVQTFNCILLTSTELFQLRIQLKNLDSKDSSDLFCCLYKSWCHNPIATVALCLLSQNYKHALNLLTLMSDVEITVELLMETDQLIQLIESPIFSYLRLQLLDNSKNIYLIKSLYGLLMLLPQSDAFYTLQHRLQCLPQKSLCNTSVLDECKEEKQEKFICFNDLLDMFTKVQKCHANKTNYSS